MMILMRKVVLHHAQLFGMPLLIFTVSLAFRRANVIKRDKFR